MKRSIVISAIILSLLVLSGVALAQTMTHPEKWSRDVKFYNAVHAGTVVLPAGEFRIRHEMDGQKHIMIFTRIGKWNEQYRVLCEMVPLTSKASTDEQHIRTAANGDTELVSLIFKGDQVRHVFAQ